MQEMSTDAHPASGTLAGSILAVDYGRARIGLAIAEAETGMPRPLLTLERINRNEDMRRLRELAREHGVRQVVVGLPLRLDGSHGEMAEEATRFAARLRKQGSGTPARGAVRQGIARSESLSQGCAHRQGFGRRRGRGRNLEGIPGAAARDKKQPTKHLT
jgi:RNase H-fold protein (predicted Holliday junction resolvase)